jgi:hypothetical protein
LLSLQTGKAEGRQRECQNARRALAFLLAFFPALKLDFAAFFAAFSPDFPALSPGSRQRRTNAPHREGCPSWESIPTIT